MVYLARNEIMNSFLGLLPKAKIFILGENPKRLRITFITYCVPSFTFFKFGSFTKRNKFYAQGANKKLTKNITNSGETSVGASKMLNKIQSFLSIIMFNIPLYIFRKYIIRSSSESLWYSTSNNQPLNQRKNFCVINLIISRKTKWCCKFLCRELHSN